MDFGILRYFHHSELSDWMHAPRVHRIFQGTMAQLPPETLLPAEGVYAARVRLDETWHQAVTNVGRKPTFGGRDVTVESFLLDTSANLYGRRVRLEFVARLRGERRFASVEELTGQIGEDVAEARKILSRTDA